MGFNAERKLKCEVSTDNGSKKFLYGHEDAQLDGAVAYIQASSAQACRREGIPNVGKRFALLLYTAKDFKKNNYDAKLQHIPRSLYDRETTCPDHA
jgi:hypothetical protein